MFDLNFPEQLIKYVATRWFFCIIFWRKSH